MNIEEIRADIFKLFDLRVDKDDPIWAFLYANREVIRNLEDILQLSKAENREYHKNLRLELEEFRKVAKDSVHTAIEQFDFRLDEFHRDIARTEKHHQEVTAYQDRFRSELKKDFDSKLENMSGIFDSHLVAIEERINNIIEAVDYTRFSDSVEREVSDVVKRSLHEIRAGVSINKKGIENLRELKDENESTIRRLENRISTITTLGVLQTVLFGASLTLLGIVYFSQEKLTFTIEEPKEIVQEEVSTEK
jgi:hypothetical protein